jgi:hypothetical protein
MVRPPLPLPGAPAPQQRSCPACEMIYEHERGCPFEGLSMAKANSLYRQQQWTGDVGPDCSSSQEPQADADANVENPLPDTGAPG